MRTSNLKAKPKQQASAPEKPKDTPVILELRLYVAGQTPKSLIALRNLKKDMR